jgi:hypothetical protein
VFDRPVFSQAATTSASFCYRPLPPHPVPRGSDPEDLADGALDPEKLTDFIVRERRTTGLPPGAGVTDR